MAISSEDPVMVYFLLVNGADVNQSACGTFFCPDDQKNGLGKKILNYYELNYKLK